MRLSIREKRRKVIKTASSGPCFPLEPDEFVDLTRTRRRNMFICFPDRVTVTSQSRPAKTRLKESPAIVITAAQHTRHISGQEVYVRTSYGR